jgi:hypothetical protein
VKNSLADGFDYHLVRCCPRHARQETFETRCCVSTDECVDARGQLNVGIVREHNLRDSGIVREHNLRDPGFTVSC